MRHRGHIFTPNEVNGMGFRGVVFEKSNLTKAKLTQVNIEGTRFDDCVIHKTVVDVPALITYGLSKGFILEVEG